MHACEIAKRREGRIATQRVIAAAVEQASLSRSPKTGGRQVDWTPIALIGFAALMIADLLVFRMVLPSRTAEGMLLRVVNGLSWVFAVFLLLCGLALLFFK
jgi:hypothetical protein